MVDNLDVNETILEDGVDYNKERLKKVFIVENMNSITSTVTNIVKKYDDETDAIEEIIKTLRTVQKERSGDANEPLLREEERRFTVFPIKYKKFWDMYKEQLAMLWKAEEIDFSKDREDYETLSDNEKTFIKYVLAFFAASDGIVNFNLSSRFLNDITAMEVQICYMFQMMMENIHGEVYSLMLDNIISDPKERNLLFNAIENVASVKAMADWAFKWIDSPKKFAYRVLAFAIVEGVFFSGAFAAIFWFKKQKAKGKDFMNGLTSSNDFIARDEGRHTAFGVAMYRELEFRIPSKEVYNIFREAVEISETFMIDAIPVKLIGMSSDMMNDYIKYTADQLIVDLGYDKLFNKKNPFTFMKTIGLDSKKNFHERRPNEYQDAHVLNQSSGDYLKNLDDNDDF
uniref:Uncharacterized protein n=1 Tax=viral metagenome TaxID=1070528 RepID=A0A6C0ACF7_9ZZZZ